MFLGIFTCEITVEDLIKNTFSDFCSPLFGPPSATKFAAFPLHTLELCFENSFFLAFTPIAYLHGHRPDFSRYNLPTDWQILLARFSHLKVLKLSLQVADTLMERAKQNLLWNLRDQRRYDGEEILRGNADHFERLVERIVESVPEGVRLDFGGDDEKSEWKKIVPERLVDQR